MDEIRIGRHLLQPNRQLLLDGEHVHLGPRALSILTTLARADGEIVTKGELMEAVWGDVVVEENALQVHVASLRKMLGEDAARLQTLRGIGYRLERGDETSGQSDAPAEVVPERSPPAAPIPPSDTGAPAKSFAGHRPRIVIAALALLVFACAAALLVWWALPSAGKNDFQSPEAVAVMPLQISGDAEWQSREQALTASLSGNLARLPDLELASETAANSVADQGLSPREIGDRLDVDHIIEGDVLADESRLVAQLRLINSGTGRPVWTSEVVGSRDHADEFEALILNRLSGILLALRRVADGDVDIPADIDPRARTAFLDGLSAMTRTNPANFTQIVRQMQLAASIAPDFADAHAGIAYTLANGSNNYFSMSPTTYANTQQDALDRALSIDPDNFTARMGQAYADLHLRGDIAAALEEAQSLVAERPGHSHANALLAMAYLYSGDHRRALSHIDRALVGDPFNYALEMRRRHILVDMGDYLSVKQAALDCRIDCWRAALDWWESLSMDGNQHHYITDIDAIAKLYDDERAFDAGAISREESILAHGRYVFRNVPNPHMRDFRDMGSTGGISHWALILINYGYVDEGFDIAMRGVELAPAAAVLVLLRDSRLTPSREIRADPRYHAIFEIPRFNAVAEYRKSKGMTAGLPVFPIKHFASKR